MVSLGGSVVRVLTMNDIEAFYSGLASHPFFNLGDMFEIAKAAGEISTARGIPYWNMVYGMYVWTQLNTEANVFGMIPKTTWPRSGWRVQTAYATGSYDRGFDFSAVASNVSTTETGAIPGPIYPEIKVVRAKPGIAVISFEVSDIMEALARTSIDDIWGTTEQMKLQMGTEFVKLINSMIARKVIGSNTDGSDTEGVTTTAYDAETSIYFYGSENGNLIESIDRVVASSEEAAAYGGLNKTNAANIYSIDRTSTANSWANSIVKYNTSGQDLTDDLIRQTLAEARSKGANTNVILTGWDTYAKIQGLYMTFVRYVPMMETKVQFGLNGIQTAQGEDVGIQVAALYGIPIIVSNDVPYDMIGGTTKGLQRIYMLDTSDFEGYGMPRLSISVLRPVEYFETRDFVLLNKFVVKGVYRMVGQLTARYLPGQAKIRDLNP